MPAHTPIDLTIAIIAVVIIPALSALTGKGLAQAAADNRRRITRYWRIVLRSAFVSLLVLGAWYRSGRPFSGLGLDVPVGRWGRVGFGIDVLIAAYYLYAIVLKQRSAKDLQMLRERLGRMNMDRMLPQTRNEYLLFPAVAIVGSTFEELVYRGFLIWFFAPITGIVGAVLVSSIAFSIGHAYQGRIGVIRTAVVGVAFGVAYTLTQSLWWLMLAHTTMNLFAVPLQRRLQRALG
jgi:uncharacterized protein